MNTTTNAPTLRGRGSLLTVAEVAKAANISARHARRLVDERRVPVVKIGNLVRVWSADLMAFLDAETIPARTTEAR